MDDIYIEIFSDLTMMLIVIISIFYLTNRDNKRQDFLNTKYDKLFTRMIDNIVQQQSSCQTELISEIRELSISMSKIFTEIEKISTGIDQIQKEVGKVTVEVKNVSFGEETLAEEITKATDEVTNVTAGMKKVVSLLESITEKVCQELDINRTK